MSRTEAIKEANRIISRNPSLKAVYRDLISTHGKEEAREIIEAVKEHISPRGGLNNQL